MYRSFSCQKIQAPFQSRHHLMKSINNLNCGFGILDIMKIA